MTPANLKDTEWETQSCVFGWSLQGAWGEYKQVDLVQNARAFLRETRSSRVCTDGHCRVLGVSKGQCI